MTPLALARERLLKSRLLEADELDACVAQFSAETRDGDGQDLLNWLAAKQRLTDFQAEAIAAGHTGSFMLGPYRVERHLTAGRWGHVFRGVHEEFQLPVSLKVFPASLHDHPDRLARMMREARVSLQLDHPNLIRTFHIGRVGRVHYLAFEDLQRENLKTRLERQGLLGYSAACRIARQAALALEYLHDQEIVHRDLEPGNLWLTPGAQVKLMEFGMARDSLAYLDSITEDHELTNTGDQLGGSVYQAPEQAQNAHSADARSDIYALGCILYEAISGRPPFSESNPLKLALAHQNDTPRLLNWLAPETPQALAEVVARMLAKTPDERYQTASEVDWALKPFLEQGAVEADVAATEWDPRYLQWVQGANSELLVDSAAGASASPAELSPDAEQFLTWLSERKR